MTTLLEKAFFEASKLPSIAQNSLAKWLLEEMEEEKKWEIKFAESEEILERLADDALDSDNKGKTKPMDFGKL
ncbi:MAG: hypothetical protein JW871_04580 [Endomicrobiales bacterium]|nr:hypothetical protein [Endomicrobiales bacterium]